MEQTYSAKQIIIIMSIILIVIGVFYGLTYLISDNLDNNIPNNNTEVDIQYSEILVGEIYNQSEDEYYVLAYNDSDGSQTYISNVKEYNSLENSIKTYLIDLTNAFNKKYVSETSNFESDFPIFKGNTLLKISKDVIVEIYEEEKITEKLNELMVRE